MAKEGTQIMETGKNPSMGGGNDYVMVVAIDFGTTYSGYAFSSKNNPTSVAMNDHWGSEMATQTWKTPTVVLTDNNKKFVAFGYHAKSIYKGKKERDRDCKEQYYMYDEGFKMKLYKEKSFDNIYIYSRDGKQQLPLRELIKMSLCYLYDHFLSRLRKSYQRFDEHLIRVMLTVPAIWDDVAKDFMRRVASEAGIGTDRLILTLEPEAASLYCRTLKPEELCANRNVDMQLSNGTVYMVVDCGGGTVDVTVHEVVDDTSVRQIYRANGGPWGGNRVNQEFEIILEQLLGQDFVREYKESHLRDWFIINSNFEFIKRTQHVEGNDYTINLPYSIIEEFNNQSTIFRRRNMVKHINKRIKEGYECKDGKLNLSKNIIETLFLMTVDEIISFVNQLLKSEKLSKVQYIFMVGGFSDSNYLFEKMKAEVAAIKPDVWFIKPREAPIAVLKGAVNFGHNPYAIKSRISRLTYGAGIMRPFIKGKHDEFRKEMVDGVAKCKDLFQVWARKNESIPVDEKRTFKIFPHGKEIMHYEVSIYAKDDENVTYTTEEGVIELATLEMVIPDKNLALEDRGIDHYVYFGGTQLFIRIEDTARPDGATNETAIVFEHDSHSSDRK